MSKLPVEGTHVDHRPSANHPDYEGRGAVPDTEHGLHWAFGAHKYCLCIVDNCTRWLSVYLLKRLTAKAVCDDLLDLFVTIGVPKVIIGDCGTNFTSQLTQEMLRKLRRSPRFNTPGHSEACCMVERFNQTYKKMLHHVVQQHGKQWHKFVPLMLLALRDVQNATTGM